MFKRPTSPRPLAEFSRVVEANGGFDNAFTSWDYTAYFQRVAADRLGLNDGDGGRAGCLVFNLVFDPVEVDTERSVIYRRARAAH